MPNVPVTGAAPPSGAASALTGWLGVAPLKIDRQTALATSYFHSISIASNVVAPIFSSDWVVVPSCHR